MSEDAPSVFNSQALTYNGPRRLLIPPFDQFYSAAVDAIGIGVTEPRRILDVGAGTGMMTSFVRETYPDAHFTLLDGAAAMLEQARESLGTHNLTFVQADFGDDLPEGPWDVVVSALAIHHYFDEGKRSLFARIHEGLRPGGVFVNAEHVLAPTAGLDAYYREWHEARAHAAGISDWEWDDAVERMEHDELSPLEDQLDWLREAGFAQVDCLFKDRGFAVMLAIKED